MPTTRQIDEAVADVCADIIQEPLLYFSEADVQQLLAERLRKVSGLQRLAKTGVRKGTDSKSKYSTSLVHREYGAGGRRRLDIVVFKRSDVEGINTTNLDVSKEGYLAPQFAFELGTEKTGDAKEHIKSDLTKLNRRVTERGYAIHIYRDTTKTAKGALRTRAEGKINRLFRKPIEDSWPGRAKKSRVVAILLRVGRDQKKMMGKCEICFGKDDWRAVNVAHRKELEKAVLEVLK